MTVGRTIRRSTGRHGLGPASFWLAAALYVGAAGGSGVVVVAQTPLPLQASQSTRLRLAEIDLPDGFVGLPFNTAVTAAGGSGVYSILIGGEVPPGMALFRSGGVVDVRGVPTAEGTYSFTVSVADTVVGGSVSHSYSLHVGPQLLRPAQSAATVNVTDAETFHVADADSVFFPAKIVDSEIFHLADGDSVFMPLRVTDAENFKLTDTISIFGPDKTPDSEAIRFGDTYSVMTSAMIRDAETLHFGDAYVVTGKVGISPATAPAGTYNTAYSQTFTPAGNTGTATFTPTGTLPSGLTFTTTTGQTKISGTPIQTGTFPFTIKVVDSGAGGTSTVAYSLVINAAPQTIIFPQPPTPVAFYIGESVTLNATSSAGAGYPVSYSVTGPATLSGSTLTYTGTGTVVVTATQAGSSTVAAATPVQVTVSVTPKQATVFIANANGSVSSITSTGAVQSSAKAGGGTGVAIDTSGYVWSINTAGNGLAQFTDTGTIAATYTPTGLTGATAVAFDGNSNLWIVGSNGSVVSVSTAGTTISTSTNSTGTTPSAIAIDRSGNLWLSNPTANTVDEIIGGAAPAQPLATAVQRSTPATKP